MREMEGKTYTPDELAYAEKLLKLFASVPEDKREILLIAGEAFIAGMKAATVKGSNHAEFDG